MFRHSDTTRFSPSDVIARWPADQPLVSVTLPGEAPPAAARWTLLATGDAVAVAAREDGEIGLPERRDVRAPSARSVDASRPGPGWIGLFPYELGGVFEPTAAAKAKPPFVGGTSGLGVTWWRVDHALLFCHDTGRWSTIGEPALAPRIESIEGAGARGVSVGAWRAETPRAVYESRVRRVIELIRAGDVFQVNLAHRLIASMRGSTRAAFAGLIDAETPAHAAYLETPDDGALRRTVLSLSPELFIRIDRAAQRVIARPMKGTRSIVNHSDINDAERNLSASVKDRAELAMIVDLMRNDLGRIAERGSVRVERPHLIERHGRLLQAIGEIEATPRPGLSIGDLLRSTFPPGSVTGAPKIRAMQIIRDLEDSPRGAYCGSIAYLEDSGTWTLSVGIRTAVASGAPGAGGRDEIDSGTIEYRVGAGIVSDSCPAAEWRETMSKATPLDAINPMARRERSHATVAGAQAHAVGDAR